MVSLASGGAISKRGITKRRAREGEGRWGVAVERGELAPGRGGMRSGCKRERASTWLVGRARIAGAPGKAPQARSPRERGEGRNREFWVPLAGVLAILASARPRQARRLAVSLPPTRSGGFSRPAAAQENVQKLIHIIARIDGAWNGRAKGKIM